MATGYAMESIIPHYLTDITQQFLLPLVLFGLLTNRLCSLWMTDKTLSVPRV